MNPIKPSELYYFRKKHLKTRKTASKMIRSGLFIVQSTEKPYFKPKNNNPNFLSKLRL